VLVVDVGGTSVKMLATGQAEHRSFPSGPTMTPKRMVSEVKKLAGDWMHDVVSMHFLMRTLPKVATEMALHVLAYNMKRVMRILGVGGLMDAMRA